MNSSDDTFFIKRIDIIHSIKLLQKMVGNFRLEKNKVVEKTRPLPLLNELLDRRKNLGIFNFIYPHSSFFMLDYFAC